MTGEAETPRDEPSRAAGAREAPKGCSLPLVVVISVVVGVLFGFFYSALAAARERARRANCASQLKSLLYACQLYSGDNEERFPSDFEVLFCDYVTDGGIFLCPSASKATELYMTDFRRPGSPGASGSVHPEHTDYVYVSGPTAAYPPDYVLMFDDEWNHAGDGVHVAFIGGLVQWMRAEELHGLLAKQKREVAARGREMRLIRPQWSSWPDPSASDDPRAGPGTGQAGSSLLAGAIVALIVSLFLGGLTAARRPSAAGPAPGDSGSDARADGGAAAAGPGTEDNG
ncbi:MAG: hypothetical protein ACYS9X_30240 [Planctomycetota bacterium]